jgi:hypothetical protein
MRALARASIKLDFLQNVKLPREQAEWSFCLFALSPSLANVKLQMGGKCFCGAAGVLGGARQIEINAAGSVTQSRAN